MRPSIEFLYQTLRGLNWNCEGMCRYRPDIAAPDHPERSSVPALPPELLNDVLPATRAAILEDLPEIMDIQDPGLREKVIAAWALSLRDSSFSRIRDIPGEGAPNHFVLRQGTQEMHLRGVAHLAMGIVDEFTRNFPHAPVDRDIVLAGALCHDIGKCWECDRVNQERWRSRPDKVGYPSMRHSVYGAHICLAAGLPEAIAHIALGHSMEGAHIALSTECTIVRWADNSWWYSAAALGLCEPDTLAAAGSMMSPRPAAA
jgi:putative nucleotidyltransferase with HDIG domain